MTALTSPAVVRQLLQTVEEQAAAEPVQALVHLRALRANAVAMRRELNEVLAGGVEARSFGLTCGHMLPETVERIATVRRLIDALSSENGTAVKELVAELRLVDQENTAFRDLLAEALAKASQPFPAADWEGLKKEADADFAAGRYTRYQTPEEMLKGLAGGD
jgi:hypothetical protein